MAQIFGHNDPKNQGQKTMHLQLELIMQVGTMTASTGKMLFQTTLVIRHNYNQVVHTKLFGNVKFGSKLIYSDAARAL